MTANTKASAQLSYSRRDVFVSCFPGEAGGRLAEPIAVRIRNNSDPETLEVHWTRDGSEVDKNRFRQWFEEVSDLVLLLDDDMVAALRAADGEQGIEPGQAGLELLALLAREDVRKDNEVVPKRLWLAKAETLRLVALKKVAGRAEWNLDQQDRDGLLHWLYDAEEKVLMHQDTLVNKKIVGADERRLGKNVDRFVDHAPELCTHCGQVHSQP